MTGIPVSRLADPAGAGRLDDIEERWMAAVEAGEEDLAQFRGMAERLATAGRADSAGALLGILIESWKGAEPDAEHLAFARQALKIGLADRTLREHAARLFERAGDAAVPAVLRALAESPNPEALARARTCIELVPGRFVMGTEVVGPERVVRFDVDAGGYVLSDGSAERTLAPKQAGAELTTLEGDHFLGLLRFAPDALKQRAEADPDGLLVSALAASGGRLEWKNLKKLLARGVVPPNQLARWWNKAKGLVDRNPLIQVYGDKEPILILRDKPITHEEELQARIDRTPDPGARASLVRAYLLSLEQGHEADGPFLAESARMLLSITADPATPNPVALIAAALEREVATRLGGNPHGAVDQDALLARTGGFGAVPEALADEEEARQALFHLRALEAEIWPAAFAEALANTSGRLAEAIARELTDHGHKELMAAALGRILALPDRHGEGLLWLFRAAGSDVADGALKDVDHFTVTLALLRLMDRWSRTARTQVTDRMKNLLARMRGAVNAGNAKILKQVIRDLPAPLARPFHDALKDNQGLTDAARHNLTQALEGRYKEELFGKRHLYEEDVIYSSPRGLKRRQQEFDQIVNVDMVKNSEAIGHAAGFGDLSENAEFTAALEQRDFLSRRANEIGEELKKAQVLTPDLVDTSIVNVGTRARVRDAASGEERTYTFLGPWDADLDNLVYSYQAPFSLAFLGKQPGDRIEARDEESVRTFEVIAVEPAEIPQ